MLLDEPTSHTLIAGRTSGQGGAWTAIIQAIFLSASHDRSHGTFPQLRVRRVVYDVVCFQFHRGPRPAIYQAMPSTFSWLDYSEHERRQMLDVIDLFGEKTTRDELGLASVRDAFADLFFPGTSTIQTRAKYFLFVPWIYLKIEGKKTPSSEAAVAARKLETRLMRAIEESGDTSGLIGRRAGGNVSRLASSVYWQGLSRWGIRVYPGSQSEYHRSLDLFYRRRAAARASNHEADGESRDAEVRNWHAGLPAPPREFPREASFDLSRAEAEYLREQVCASCPDSLLAYFVHQRIPAAGATFFWEGPWELPRHFAEQTLHARNFSETMWGAQLLYNLMLAEKRRSEERIRHYRDLLADWAWQLEARADAYEQWSRDRFWQVVSITRPRVPKPVQRFVDSWLTLVIQVAPGNVVEDDGARQLVAQREARLKGSLARLRNYRALELWSGAAGASQLNFRWGTAKSMIEDILAGLSEGNGA